MKYIGVDADKGIYAFNKKPEWRFTHIKVWNWAPLDYMTDLYTKIPASVLPLLEPCCLYRIDKDCYTLIEDRRK
jgi:hypothetical protein